MRSQKGRTVKLLLAGFLTGGFLMLAGAILAALDQDYTMPWLPW